MTFSISYDDDLKLARQLLEEVAAADERVMAEPACTVAVQQLGESSVDLSLRPFAHRDDYWAVLTEMPEQVKKRLDEAGITIPYPQRDIHLYQPNSENKIGND